MTLDEATAATIRARARAAETLTERDADRARAKKRAEVVARREARGDAPSETSTFGTQMVRLSPASRQRLEVLRKERRQRIRSPRARRAKAAGLREDASTLTAILDVLAEGEAGLREFALAVHGEDSRRHRCTCGMAATKLVDKGLIVRVRRGVYALARAA